MQRCCEICQNYYLNNINDIWLRIFCLTTTETDSLFIHGTDSELSCMRPPQYWGGRQHRFCFCKIQLRMLLSSGDEAPCMESGGFAPDSVWNMASFKPVNFGSFWLSTGCCLSVFGMIPRNFSSVLCKSHEECVGGSKSTPSSPVAWWPLAVTLQIAEKAEAAIKYLWSD